MGPLMNSTKHLKNKLYQFSTISFRRQKQREYFKLILGGQHYPDTKTKQAITRKLQTNISHEYRHKNSQQNISKSNPKKYKKNYIPQPSGINPRHVRLVQHSKINQCRTSLVVQWLRIHLPMQGTRVRSLVQEAPTCRRATKSVHHNY